MKQDPYFKFVAAALIAAVLLAFTSSPSPARPARVHAAKIVPAGAISARS